jgi:hypothetical protein
MNACVHIAPMIGSRPGELSAEENRALASHLETCPACRALASSFAATEGLLAEGLLARANARDFGRFVDEVMAKVSPRPAIVRGFRGRAVLATLRERWKLAAVGAAAAVVLAAVSSFMYGGGRVEEPERLASMEIELSGGSTVLQTPDGPVVLLALDDGQGS